MTEPVRIVFVDRDPPSGFMATDLELLQSTARVERIVYPGRPTPSWIVQSIRAVRRNDVVYAFFASEQALVPALVAAVLRRRFLLIPGGYDYANVPEHRYGLAARGLGWLPRLLGRLCTVALPISDQSMWEFVVQVPSAAPRTARAYLAVDPATWPDPGVERDPDQVVTVGYVDEEAWSRKGIDRFVEAARQDPGRRYVLAGRLVESVARRIDADRPPNLSCPGRLEHDDLRRLLWGSGVYAQLSWHETFGVAMAEAMLCGCVPVVRASAALHEVAGPWAVVAEGEPAAADVEAIDRAAGIARGSSSAERRAMADDIAARFSAARRVQALADAAAGRVPVEPPNRATDGV